MTMRGGGFEAGGPTAYSVEADARATYGAARVERRRKVISTGRGIVGATAVIAVALLYSVLLGQVRPFRYWDAVLLIAVAVVPTEVALTSFYLQDHPLALVNAVRRARRKGLIAFADLAAGVVVFALILPANGILFANQKLDDAAGVAQAFPVLRKWVSHGRHSTTFYAAVEPSGRAPLRRLSFYADQPVAVPRSCWEALVPGESTLTLVVHPGRIGLPWYELGPTGGL